MSAVDARVINAVSNDSAEPAPPPINSVPSISRVEPVGIEIVLPVVNVRLESIVWSATFVRTTVESTPILLALTVIPPFVAPTTLIVLLLLKLPPPVKPAPAVIVVPEISSIAPLTSVAAKSVNAIVVSTVVAPSIKLITLPMSVSLLTTPVFRLSSVPAIVAAPYVPVL